MTIPTIEMKFLPRIVKGSYARLSCGADLVATACRVVWVSRDDLRNIHKLGVEFVDDAPTFWGAAYEERLALGLEQGDQSNSRAAEESTGRR